MNNDQVRVLTHLAYRKVYVEKTEIESAWHFEALDTALAALLKAKRIATLNEVKYRITAKGRSALKKG